MTSLSLFLLQQMSLWPWAGDTGTLAVSQPCSGRHRGRQAEVTGPRALVELEWVPGGPEEASEPARLSSVLEK